VDKLLNKNYLQFQLSCKYNSWEIQMQVPKSTIRK